MFHHIDTLNFVILHCMQFYLSLTFNLLLVGRTEKQTVRKRKERNGNKEIKKYFIRRNFINRQTETGGKTEMKEDSRNEKEMR